MTHRASSKGRAFCVFLAVVCSLAVVPALAAQETARPDTARTEADSLHPPSLSISTQPMVAIPTVDSEEYFGLGGTLGLGIERSFAGNPQLFLAGNVEYSYLPVQDDASSASLLAALAGGGACFWFTPRFGVRMTGLAGYHLGFLNDVGSPSGHLALRGGIALEYLLVPAMDLALGAAYRYDLGSFQALSAYVSLSYFLRGTEGRRLAMEESQRRRTAVAKGPRTPEKGRGLELSEVELAEIFPVLFKYYDDHPVGTAVLHNRESKAISDITLTFFIKQYMDSPKQCPAPSMLAAGESQKVEIMSLLADRALQVSEPTKVAADLTLEYRMGGDLYRETRTLTVRILDQNAMTWDDDRKAAAFVTARDSMVLDISKTVAGLAREQAVAGPNPNLLTAMGLVAAMELYGLAYVVDPKTPFVDYSKDGSLVDYLQFPRQTLGYQAGDCDDLSILFAALLESVGVETAFVTVPGHIFLAFSTGLSAEDAGRTFSDVQQLIIVDGESWVPLETTMRKGGFLKAWDEGAREWREASSRRTAGFHRMHEAWKLYEPVGLPGSSERIALPDPASIAEALRKELGAFVDREIAPRVARLQESIRSSGGDQRSLNKLGILYSQYGRYEQAEKEFLRAIERQEFVPALLNLGNLALLSGKPGIAQEYFERAAKQEPRHPQVLAGLARVYHENGQDELSRSKLEELSAVAPALAERYSYLRVDSAVGGRASAKDMPAPSVEWVE